MKVLNCIRVREKWYEVFFSDHSIRKVARNFETDSREFLLFENLLLSFTEHANINNKYALMGGLDFGLYEEKFYKSAMALMSVLNDSRETDFEISYKKRVMYVTLKVIK